MSRNRSLASVVGKPSNEFLDDSPEDTDSLKGKVRR